MDFGLLVARLVLGVLMAAHGSQKLFGWFGDLGWTGQDSSWKRWASVLAGAMHCWPA